MMPIGTIEIVAIVLSLGLVALFGRKAFKELLRMVFGAKKDVEEVKKEFEKTAKN